MRWMLDEMLPPAAAQVLNERGHDAVCVTATALRSARDEAVYSAAVAQDRVIVTEDQSDYARILRQALDAGVPVVPVVVVRKDRLPRGGALPHRLAEVLHRWSLENPTPYPGPHYLSD